MVWRILLIAVCGFATWRSIRTARADWLASEGTLDGFERAIRLAPDDERLLARAALFRNDNGDPSAAVDEDLRRAAKMNPLDSSVLMTLGLREEFRGNSAEAESDLVSAAEVDHQFKPAWTLANYYYRANRLDKAWPMIQRVLSLEPLGYDPTPVFELCWQMTDAGKIPALIPKRGHRPIQYLDFLMRTRRFDAAFKAWPEALAAADATDLSDVATLTGFVDYLTGVDRIEEAVKAWNQLVERGMIRSGPLDPAKGVSIADPDFKFAPLAQAFGWRTPEIAGVFASEFSGSVRFEITGEEPQSLQFLSTFAPVLSDTRYRLAWKSDASALSAPRDPGFKFLIVQEPGDVTTECPPMLSTGNAGSCDFVTQHDNGTGRFRKIRIDLQYSRALGTTRVSGVLQLSNVHLEFAR